VLRTPFENSCIALIRRHPIDE
jgi:3-keto-L-gulonate-6-phosphate decarboxylase